MQLKDTAQSFHLSDEELLVVSGGSALQSGQGEESKEGRFITSKLSTYSSGENPKYSVGDFVKIKWRVSAELEVLCNAEVLGISEDRNGGLMFRKYTYSIKIQTCPNSDMIGLIESGVHENCLYL